MRYAFITSFFFILLVPGISRAQELNAGFVEGLWYSAEEIFAEETVRMSVALRNTSENDLTGTVHFYANGERIGSTVVEAKAGELIEAWTDWRAKAGEFEITAELKDIQLYTIGGSTTTIEVASSLAKDLITIDRDTDGDGIGNKEDEDDDGDGISDEEEIENGTDPLVSDASNEDESKNSATSTNGAGEKERESKNEPQDDPEGLERFIAHKASNNILTGVTETINSTKHSLDTYREERRARIDSHGIFDNQPKQAADTQLTTATGTDASSTARATITRTRIEPEPEKGYLAKSWDAFLFILDSLYTLLLAITSLALSFPLFVEVILLILILYAIYAFAKRLARRPIDG